jgi:hypothetical protein
LGRTPLLIRIRLSQMAWWCHGRAGLTPTLFGWRGGAMGEQGGTQVRVTWAEPSLPAGLLSSKLMSVAAMAAFVGGGGGMA